MYRNSNAIYAEAFSLCCPHFTYSPELIFIYAQTETPMALRDASQELAGLLEAVGRIFYEHPYETELAVTLNLHRDVRKNLPLFFCSLVDFLWERRHLNTTLLYSDQTPSNFEIARLMESISTPKGDRRSMFLGVCE